MNASARASAEASASAGSYFNARAYDMGGFRGGGYGGGTIYAGGGGYGGDVGYGYTGGAVYYDIDRRALACASAPYGYIVIGFGRDDRRAPSCGGRYVEYRDEGYDRGGRYGYSERHDSYQESSYESYESVEEYEAYEGYGAYEDRSYEDRSYEDRSYEDRDYHERDRGDCGCREPAPYPAPYLPEPPRYEPPAPPPARPHRPRRPHHEAPPPPRQEYRQEPGERG
ncbi:hypothetical protein GGQ87_001031 [Brevundimonas alba]|uniref:Uncharacterized protein n=1 Tax=Brevundimonas alba TaxID=74314 RepID=A0A7X5YIV9_9CAUL|nr:hypothetical protein [Brevundimonas alba]NJC40773.1 hypothetical protein [Brevundimonas alba]